MRVLVHDYSGHPFQVELSRELARRGHQVTHSYSAAYVSGKGRLDVADDDLVTFEAVGHGVVLDKRFHRRLWQEIVGGVELARHVAQVKPDVALMSNVQVPTLMIFAVFMWFRRIPWVLWHQDAYAVAIRSFAGARLSPAYRVVASGVEIGERWASHRAAAVVAISDAMASVHHEWGTRHKVSVIPNWAPLGEIVPVERKNDWSVAHDLDEVTTLLYSGTLGLKHNPTLLVELAGQVAELGRPVRLVVVNEGPAVPVLRAEAERLGVPLDIFPFQPYEDLPQVLGSGDVLVVLLEKEAGVFSVPSKTLSYLCAGRPVLGLMPHDNSAAALIRHAGGFVADPTAEALAQAAAWLSEVLGDRERLAELGMSSRALAETEFNLNTIADQFESILVGTQRR